MGQITDNELEMLSDEERAALDGDTGDGSTDEIKEQLAEGKTDEEIAAELALAEEAKAKALEDEKEKDAPVIQQPASADPLFKLESNQDLGTIEEIEEKMQALDTKFEDGDVTLAEYNKERAGYVEAITEIKMFDKINAQVQAAAAAKGWKDAQADFFRSNQEYSTERIKNVAFVDAVNRLLATDESKTMSDVQILKAAKEECDAVFYPSGRTVKQDGEKAATTDEKQKVIGDAKKAEAANAAGTKTLTKVPVSESNMGDDKYDAIDKLTGDAYEMAVAKLSNAERAVYASR